jgi:hypothetical protein
LFSIKRERSRVYGVTDAQAAPAQQFGQRPDAHTALFRIVRPLSVFIEVVRRFDDFGILLRREVIGGYRTLRVPETVLYRVHRKLRRAN